ncbi:MAG: hypothetical protein JNM48_05240 [Rhodospirillales bacterium]|nr:hypothetical protein [Rhodospirillales bacterium]
MFDLHPILISAESIPDWLAVAFFAFWAGLPALARWLLTDTSEPAERSVSPASVID